MKAFLNFLLLIGIGFGVAAGQAYDTSIFQEGNTWVYSRIEYMSAVSQRSGIQTLTLRNLRIEESLLKFDVFQQDTIATISTLCKPTPCVLGEKKDSSAITYTYDPVNNSFSPSPVPFFASGQIFDSTSMKVVYKGDTLRRNQAVVEGCGTSVVENLERYGRTLNRWIQGCGNNVGRGYEDKLLSFNGQPFDRGSVQPVALNREVRPNRAGADVPKAILSKQHRILFGTEGAEYDARGQRGSTQRGQSR